MPNPDTQDFSAEMLFVSVGGVVVTGFAAGDCFSIEPKGDDWKAKAGHHGSLSVSQLVNDLVDIKLTLNHGVPSHAALLAVEEAAKTSSSPRLAFVAKDLLSGTTYTGECWRTKPAAIKGGDEGGDHEHAYEGRVTETQA
jgi:hypothetical protein